MSAFTFIAIPAIVQCVVAIYLLVRALLYLHPPLSETATHLRRFFLAEGTKMLLMALFGIAYIIALPTIYLLALGVTHVLSFGYALLSLYMLFSHFKRISEEDNDRTPDN